MSDNRVSVYIAYLLRHNPGELNLDMDIHGWVSVSQLLDRINASGKHRLTMDALTRLVRDDNKGRYRFSDDGRFIRACQGHTISWVEPVLETGAPPSVLYHGTTEDAWEKIRNSGFISKMSRHAVHMQPDLQKAWQSARRWRRTPVVLKIDAERMHREGFSFAVSDNGVWCTERVPTQYILEIIRE